MKIQYKFIGYGLAIVLLIVVSFLFLRGNPVKKDVLGGFGSSEGEYIVVETNNWGSPISSVPVILHRIIIGTANDSVVIADDTTTPSTNKMFQITATVPGTFDIETIFSKGLVANVTSTNGIIFITSNYK